METSTFIFPAAGEDLSELRSMCNFFFFNQKIMPVFHGAFLHYDLPLLLLLQCGDEYNKTDMTI